jgi:hypothetical protein
VIVIRIQVDLNAVIIQETNVASHLICDDVPYIRIPTPKGDVEVALIIENSYFRSFRARSAFLRFSLDEPIDNSCLLPRLFIELPVDPNTAFNSHYVEGRRLDRTFLGKGLHRVQREDQSSQETERAQTGHPVRPSDGGGESTVFIAGSCHDGGLTDAFFFIKDSAIKRKNQQPIPKEILPSASQDCRRPASPPFVQIRTGAGGVAFRDGVQE